jgi:protein gp37
MSDKSNIEWCDTTWNPVTGCTKVSEGCRNCYAATFAERWRGTKGHYFENGFDLTLRPDKLDQPLKWTKPRKIFVNSMSDLFHKDVPDDFIDQVFAVMALCPQHTFQILTKRPERMFEYFNVLGRQESLGHIAMYLYEKLGGRGDCSLAAGLIHGSGRATNLPEVPERPVAWPLPNVWLGTSVENQKAADERIPLLLQTPAAVRFLSCEPLLGEVNLRPWFPWDRHRKNKPGWKRNPEYQQGIHWVIVGGESGHGARPMHPEWARSLRDQCQAAGVSFFFKQWGEWHPLPWKQIETSGKAKYFAEIDWTFIKTGKHQAGRLLDGREWNEFPNG